MTKGPTMLKVFPQPLKIAFKQPPNLTRMLCHAKLPSLKQTKGKLIGMKPRNEQCPYIKTYQDFCSSQTKERLEMTSTFNCNTKGIVYLALCTNCNKNLWSKQVEN